MSLTVHHSFLLQMFHRISQLRILRRQGLHAMVDRRGGSCLAFEVVIPAHPKPCEWVLPHQPGVLNRKRRRMISRSYLKCRRHSSASSSTSMAKETHGLNSSCTENSAFLSCAWLSGPSFFSISDTVPLISDIAAQTLQPVARSLCTSACVSDTTGLTCTSAFEGSSRLLCRKASA